MNTIEIIYKKLYNHWGSQKWWPTDSKLEIIIGSILSQNTSWKNAEKAILNLKENNFLNLKNLSILNKSKISELIKPAGYYNQKTEYILCASEIINNKFLGSINNLFKLDIESLRIELLSWKGIGKETADSIILYAAEKPIFVIDSYTKRMLSRHNIGYKITYDDAANLFMKSLPKNVKMYNEFHALIVKLGQTYCKTKPNCSKCPLSSLFNRVSA